MATWTNWSRLSTAHPRQEVSPHDAGEVVEAVLAARHQNLTVKLPGALEKLDLTLHNMGDIDEQTVAGAISTGTHGTGGQRASLSAQVSGLELVTGRGELMRADAQQNPEVLDAARLGRGALGILTAVTFDVEPMFTME